MQLARTLSRAGTALAAAFALLLSASPAAQADTRDPVLFVHGLGGQASNWDHMIDDFVAAGWSRDQLHAISYDSAKSSTLIAAEIKAEVDTLRARTGSAKVDIVTHSLGALNTRYYLKFLGGTSYVDDWVSMGGVNYGTYGALSCLLDSCREAWPGSSFLNQLNGGDPSPGAVNYTAIWSSCDEAVNPDSFAQLEGATNWWAGCVGHESLKYSYAISVRTMQAVQ
ncbi:esterase/lipase family protein [Streptomyces sp. NPDC057580]|uniref:esterase/lipase family protein n=1 Tax=Streptomyces sp. NPDC057580 TaxID=3346173 RepID=UPI0036B48F72